MSWNIKPQPEPATGLPPVGTFWRHQGSGIIYLRIDDEVGASVMKHDEEKKAKSFYSIHDGGKITFTTRDRSKWGPLELIPASWIEGLR